MQTQQLLNLFYALQCHKILDKLGCEAMDTVNEKYHLIKIIEAVKVFLNGFWKLIVKNSFYRIIFHKFSIR